MPERLKWSRDLEYERVAHKRMGEAALQIAAQLGLDPEDVRQSMAMAPPPLGYKLGDELRALVGREPVGRDDDELVLRWHISVNGAGAPGGPRLATWHELADAAHQIRPGVTFVLGIPPRSWWMAQIESGEYVLHLWQMEDPMLERSWMLQRTPGGRKPS